MEKSEIRMYDMVAGVIRNGQLTMEQEDSLRSLLVERDHARKCKSLAEYIERESRKTADIEADAVKELQGRLFRYCVRGSSVGDKCLSEFSEDDVRKFIVQTAVLYEMDKKSWLVFLAMLQKALNAMSLEGALNFEPPRKMPEAFLEAAKRKRGIEKPYAGEELERVKAWLEQSPLDVRGLAIALWLEGDVSPEEIAGLKKSDLMDGSGGYCGNPVVVKKNASEDYLLLTKTRKRIILAALELHPEADQEYIFMDMNHEGGLEKLSKTSLQPKMSSICRQVGILYKSFKCTDMILWGLD